MDTVITKKLWLKNPKQLAIFVLLFSARPLYLCTQQIFIMGNLIQPSCTCGYFAVPMMQGLGDSFFESGIYYEPAWCSNCTIVEPRNGNEKEPTCCTCHDKMHFYKRGYATPNTTSILPDTNYLQQKKYWFYPACKQEKLEFIFVGLWD